MNEPTLNGDLVQGSLADNATASATKPAIGSQRIFACGVAADYSATVAAIKTVTLKLGTATKMIVRWNFANGPFVWSFPAMIHGDYNQAVSVELEASGTGGITGRATLFYFLD